MSKMFFAAGEYITTEQEGQRFRLLEPVTFHGKFYFAHAWDTFLEKDCLLKYVDCKDASYEINNLVREGGFQFFYPYIETVYGNFSGVDPHGDEIYGVAVEYVDGKALDTYRKDLEVKMQVEEVSEADGEALIFRQMLQFLMGMNYYTQFSGKRYLHRDIKPQNVMITADGDVKIVDFDYAHLSGSDKTMFAIGWNLPFSTGYTSPEAFTHKAKKKSPDLVTEIYAAGRVLFFWLNGRNYYTEDQRQMRHDPATGASIPSSALYCLNEDLSYGIDANRDRFQKKYLEPEFAPLLRILERMCCDPDSEIRYESVADIIRDYYQFLLYYYGGDVKLVAKKLRLEELPILMETDWLGDRSACMVAVKVAGGRKVGKPLYVNSMRDITSDGDRLVTIYNLDGGIYYIPIQGKPVVHQSCHAHHDVQAMDYYRIYDKDVLICGGISVAFSISESRVEG